MSENEIEQAKGLIELSISRGLKEEEEAHKSILQPPYIEKLAH